MVVLLAFLMIAPSLSIAWPSLNMLDEDIDLPNGNGWVAACDQAQYPCTEFVGHTMSFDKFIEGSTKFIGDWAGEGQLGLWFIPEVLGHKEFTFCFYTGTVVSGGYDWRLCGIACASEEGCKIPCYATPFDYGEIMYIYSSKRPIDVSQWDGHPAPWSDNFFQAVTGSQVRIACSEMPADAKMQYDNYLSLDEPYQLGFFEDVLPWVVIIVVLIIGLGGFFYTKTGRRMLKG